MKTLFVCLSLFVLFAASNLNAQIIPKTIHYGFTVGANLSGFDGNGIKKAYTTGVLAGVFSEIAINKKWNFQPSVLYNFSNLKKGDDFLNFYNINGNPDAAVPVKLSYISVPLLFSYKLTKVLSVVAGPQYSFLVYDNENLLLENKAAAFKRNDISIVAGIQAQLENFRFFGRYAFGLTNVNNIDNRYNWYNRQAQVGISVVVF